MYKKVQDLLQRLEISLIALSFFVFYIVSPERPVKDHYKHVFKICGLTVQPNKTIMHVLLLNTTLK